jgi:hypothetical protein
MHLALEEIELRERDEPEHGEQHDVSADAYASPEAEPDLVDEYNNSAVALSDRCAS